MVFSIEINLLIVEINRVGTLLMALQIHNATDELVKNKSHILPLSGGNIRRLQIWTTRCLLFTGYLLDSSGQMGELNKFGIFQNLQIIPCSYM